MSAVSDYLEEKARTKAEATINSQKYVLKKFDEEVGVKEATVKKIYDWFDGKIEKGMRKTSANQEMNILKGFFRYYRDNLPTPIGEDELRSHLENQKRANRIIKMDRYRAADSSGNPVPRKVFLNLLELSDMPNTYLFFLLGYLGLRKGELYSLKKGDVDLDDKSLHIRAEETKTFRERTLYFNDHVAGMLEEMMDSADSPYVIGFKADRNYLNRHLSKYDEEVGEHLYPHRMRHTFNHNMRRILEDRILVKWLMGHQTSQDMSARYDKPIEEISREAMTSKHYYREWGISDGV